MTTNTWLGIDIAKDTFETHLLSGARVYRGTFENSPAGYRKLDHWLKKKARPAVHACLEATGRYGEGVAEHLHAAGHIVSIINPAQSKAFGQATLRRTKTDRTDAALLAEFCRTQAPAPWQPRPTEMLALRALVRRRESLLQLRQQEANRLASGEQIALVQASLEKMLALLTDELAGIEQAIAAHVAAHPAVQCQHALLDSIPGIGHLTAAALLAEIDFSAYPSARPLAAHAGLTPRQRQSGTSIHGRPHISKQGPSHLRRILFFPALVAMRHNPAVRDLAERLRDRHKAKMAIVCAAMRKLLHLAYGVLKTGKPFDPDYQPARAAKPLPAPDQQLVPA